MKNDHKALIYIEPYSPSQVLKTVEVYSTSQGSNPCLSDSPSLNPTSLIAERNNSMLISLKNLISKEDQPLREVVIMKNLFQKEQSSSLLCRQEELGVSSIEDWVAFLKKQQPNIIDMLKELLISITQKTPSSVAEKEGWVNAHRVLAIVYSYLKESEHALSILTHLKQQQPAAMQDLFSSFEKFLENKCILENKVPVKSMLPNSHL